MEKSIIYFILFVSMIIVGIFIMKIFTEQPEFKSDETIEKRDEVIKECEDGQSVECKKNGCKGIKTCIDGKWLYCNVERECIPGTTIGCHYDQCRYGIKTCNKCAKWGPCKLT